MHGRDESTRVGQFRANAAIGEDNFSGPTGGTLAMSLSGSRWVTQTTPTLAGSFFEGVVVLAPLVWSRPAPAAVVLTGTCRLISTR